MANRQGLTNPPFELPKMDFGRIPRLRDWIVADSEILRICQFFDCSVASNTNFLTFQICFHFKAIWNPNIQRLNLVINQMDPT